MPEKTDEVIQEVLGELRQHPALSSLTDIAPAIGELSHQWNATGHFAAREASSGRQVVIKVGVTEAERYWTAHLSQTATYLFPQVFAVDHIPTRGDRDRINFIVLERVPYTLIGPAWEGRQTDMLLDAGARFYQAAGSIVPRHLSRLSADEIHRWLAEGRSKNPPGDWGSVLAHADEDYVWLSQACPFEVCHGDLHVGNALSRTPPPDGAALLIDLNPVLQPWVFDAAWVEVCAWEDQPQRGAGYATRQLADCRRVLGLDVASADVREKAGRVALAWLAIRIWDPDHLEFMPGFKEAMETHINSGATVQR